MLPVVRALIVMLDGRGLRLDDDDRDLPVVDLNMSRVYRVSKGQEVGEVVDSIKAIEAFARDHGPGWYHVDERAAEYLPGDSGLECGVGRPARDGRTSRNITGSRYNFRSRTTAH
jgi:hypothetical protein